jgi:ABC-type uncharacterized transport system permease subunit
MTHTNLYKNEIYLVVTSLISIGVLGGYAYFDLALAALIILPAINTLDKKVFSRKRSHSDNLNKCASCK